MILHHVRKGLLGPRGVPLGLLGFGFQLNSVAYFFTPEFWGGLRGSRLGKRKLSLRILAIALAFLLANLAGPSSAITMIPKLDWWPLHAMWPANEIQFHAYIEAPNGTIFPQSITRSLVPDYCFEEQPDTKLQMYCPSGGLSNILTTAPMIGTPLSTTNYARADLNTNFSMPAANNSVTRFVSGQFSSFNVGNSSLFLASAMPDFAASSLHWWYSLVAGFQAGGYVNNGPLRSSSTRALIKAMLRSGGELLQLYKPLVQVECQASSFDDPTITFPHDLFFLPPWNSPPFSQADWSVPTPLMSDDASTDQINFTWIDLAISEGPRPSILALFTMPLRDRSFSDMYACTVDARWVPTQPWIDPSTDKFVHDYISRPVPDLLQETDRNGLPTPPPPIYIDPGWAESLNVVQSATQNLTGLGALGLACVTALTRDGAPPRTRGSDPMIQCLDSALAIYLTDGLTRLQSSIPMYFVATGQTPRNTEVLDIHYLDHPWRPGNSIASLTLPDFRDPTRFTELYMPVWRYGYGFGFPSGGNGGITLYLATAVLLLHALLALVHMAILLSSGRSSSAWGSVGEMLVLALNSRGSARLQNTCAGVGESKTWGMKVQIRETTEEHLELVLEGDGEGGSDAFADGVGDGGEALDVRAHMPPRRDKAYGGLPSAGTEQRWRATRTGAPDEG